MRSVGNVDTRVEVYSCSFLVADAVIAIVCIGT